MVFPVHRPLRRASMQSEEGVDMVRLCLFVALVLLLFQIGMSVDSAPAIAAEPAAANS